MTHHDILKKLIGEIEPVGKTEIDNVRLENLKVLSSLVENLLMDIEDIAFDFKDSQEYSVKRAADFADAFLKRIRTDMLLQWA